MTDKQNHDDEITELKKSNILFTIIFSSLRNIR